MTDGTGEGLAAALRLVSNARCVPSGLLLAVSGGPDSLALLLAASASRADLPPLAVATVDHGLRPESASEAEVVGALCAALGLPHRVLPWRRPEGAGGNLAASAREARYALLAREARRCGADAVVTAHHFDDQLETHLLARARGVALQEAAGMRVWRDLQPGLVLLRPFLSLRKSALVDLVTNAGIQPADDPGNRNPRSARVRLRLALAAGEHDEAALGDVLRAADRHRMVRDDALAGALRELVANEALRIGEGGEIELAAAALAPALLSRCLTAAGGAAVAPSARAVQRLAEALAAEPRFAATLNGCRVERGGDRLSFLREYGRGGIAPVSNDGPNVAFDNRFDIRPPAGEGAGGPMRIVAWGSLGRGNPRDRTLPVALDDSGRPIACHPALSPRLPGCAPLALHGRVGWRLWADLPGAAPFA